MRFLVTSGPAYESLDNVRRLTNFSTGHLATELGNYLTAKGHSVTLLQGFYSTYKKPSRAGSILGFTTTENLLARFKECSSAQYDAIFHAAAVSDFTFGKVFRRNPAGQLEEITSGKFSTCEGTLLAELLPTPKLISRLRALFPTAKIVGWKYEVDGKPDDVIALGVKQIHENKTNCCVVNGPAYGQGFGVVLQEGLRQHCSSGDELYDELLRLVCGA